MNGRELIFTNHANERLVSRLGIRPSALYNAEIMGRGKYLRVPRFDITLVMAENVVITVLYDDKRQEKARKKSITNYYNKYK